MFTKSSYFYSKIISVKVSVLYASHSVFSSPLENNHKTSRNSDKRNVYLKSQIKESYFNSHTVIRTFGRLCSFFVRSEMLRFRLLSSGHVSALRVGAPICRNIGRRQSRTVPGSVNKIY